MPVRKLRLTSKSITGIRASAKGRGISFESTLERDLIVLMQFDPAVLSIEEQPLTVFWIDDAGRRRRYTPDFLIRAEAATRLIEVKPTTILAQQADELRPKFEAATQYAGERGWRFEVWTEREIRTPRLANAKFLLGYRQRVAAAGLAEDLVDAIDRTNPISVNDLLQRAFPDEDRRARGLAELWRLLAVGAVAADLEQELSPATLITPSVRIRP